MNAAERRQHALSPKDRAIERAHVLAEKMMDSPGVSWPVDTVCRELQIPKCRTHDRYILSGFEALYLHSELERHGHYLVPARSGNRVQSYHLADDREKELVVAKKYEQKSITCLEKRVRILGQVVNSDYNSEERKRLEATRRIASAELDAIKRARKRHKDGI